MNFLSIDCGTNFGSLYLKHKNKSFFKSLQSLKFSNDELMNKILDLFSESNLSLSNISEIYVNLGPGSFSGLRSSISTAKGISISKNLKLFGYNNFLWTASDILKNKKKFYCLLKFHNKFFIQKFERNIHKFFSPTLISVDEIIKKYNNDLKITNEDTFNSSYNEISSLKNLNLVKLDHKQLEFLRQNDLLEKKLIKPLYLS